MTLFSRVLSTPEALEAFSDRAILGHMLRFEAALARASAKAGLVPDAAAQTIVACCDPARFDMAAIEADGRSAGTVVIPLVKTLRQQVGARDAGATAWVHFGGTSQDVIDSALAMATGEALGLIKRDLRDSVRALLELAERHRDAPILARTLLQPASVTSFGLKCAQWGLPLTRSLERISQLAPRALCLQLGGAAGTRAQFGAKGGEIAAAMAAELSLGNPPSAWHTQRDEWVALGCELGVLCGSLGKIGTDLSLLGQFEVGEVAEPGGGSSAMPHKKNPLGSMIARSAALRAPHRVAALLSAMPQEHERALGGWQAESAEWGELLQLAHGSAHAVRSALQGLRVDEARMRDNLEAVRKTLPESEQSWFHADIARALSAQAQGLCDAIRSLLDSNQ